MATRMASSCVLAAALIATLAPGARGQDSTNQARHGAAIDAAVEAAQAWLALLDQSRYAESWDEAAAAFRQAVSKSYWENQVAQVRAPFVPFGERTLVRTQYVDSLPNAPPGPYVILEYRSQVRGDRTVIERVVPMREAEGVWRVSGYYVLPR